MIEKSLAWLITSLIFSAGSILGFYAMLGNKGAIFIGLGLIGCACVSRCLVIEHIEEEHPGYLMSK